jgi:hypothetical protein
MRGLSKVSGGMPYAFSTEAEKVLTGSEWIHEVKRDSYRMIVIRDHEPRAADQQRRS